MVPHLRKWPSKSPTSSPRSRSVWPSFRIALLVLAFGFPGGCSKDQPQTAEQANPPASMEPLPASVALSADTQEPATPVVEAAPPPLQETKPVRRSQAIVRAGGEDVPAPWRFRADDRHIKVVLLAGSIGAWLRDPYARQLEQVCSQIEVKNLSKVGYGAHALKKRFRDAVLKNPQVSRARKGHVSDEYWLLFGGGLNSVGDPDATNRQIRELFVLAHEADFHVVGLSLTPWGDDKDSRRWASANGWTTWRQTGQIVNFVLGKSTPAQALGKRAGAGHETFTKAELADVAVDLWDSPLRDRQAALRELESTRKAMTRNHKVRRYLREIPEEELEREQAASLEIARSVPRWYLHPQYRSFDAIHPNDAGHRVIAELICLQLPANWGCNCALLRSQEANLVERGSMPATRGEQ